MLNNEMNDDKIDNEYNKMRACGKFYSFPSVYNISNPNTHLDMCQCIIENISMFR